jgi:protein TonB
MLFAWTPNASTPGVLIDEESPGVEVELLANSDLNNEETTTPAEDPPTPEPTPFPEPTPLPEEPPSTEEQPEVLPEAEAPPSPAPTPVPPRPAPKPPLPKPKRSNAAQTGKPSASPNTDGSLGNGSPTVSTSQAAFSKRPALIYPAESRQAREEGTVILRITVDARGRPTNVVIIKPSGHPRLDRAAIEGAWRCRIRNAKPGMILDVPLRFDLDE